MKTTLKVLGAIAILISALLIACVQYTDTTDYKEMAYYQYWKESIANKTYRFSKSTKSKPRVGSAKVSLVPDEPVPLAGYGKRRGASYTNVHDSIYVRTLCLEVAGYKQFFSSIDMLIVPPPVTELVKQELKSRGIHFEQVYLTATHTHNSIGGWYDTFVGELFAGDYDPAIEVFIANKIIESIDQSSIDLQECSLQYEEDIDSTDVYNRLLKNDFDIDPEIRSVTFTTSQKRIALTSYAAHSTVLDAKVLELSRDYPGLIIDSLESSSYDFAVFMAGAVGSMGPAKDGNRTFKDVKQQGQGVLREFWSENEKTVAMADSLEIKSFWNKIPLRVPSPRISQKFSLRPWLFYKLFGEYPAFIKACKVGNTLFIGLPCDFSGELMADLDKYAAAKGMNLIITSFNGAYAGYITDDRHFGTDHYETITMSWFGPQNGAYFSEAISDVIDLME